MLELKADLGKLRTDMNNAVGIVDRSMASISRVAATARTALAGIATGLVGGLAAGGLASAVKQIADYGDKLRDLSIATGASVEQLSFLDFAATQSGASLDSLTTGISRLQRNLAEVSQGGGKAAAAALESLGLAAQDLARQDILSQITAIGSALQTIENPAERAATAQALFGRGARELLPLLLEGETGIAGLRDRFIELNGAITGEQGDLFDNLNDSIGELQAATKGAAAAFAETLAPSLTTFFNVLTNGVGLIRETSASLVENFVYAFVQAQKAIAETRAALTDFFTIDGAARGNTSPAAQRIQADLAEAKRLQGVLDQIRADSYDRDVQRQVDLRKKLSGSGAAFGDIDPGVDEEAAKRTQRAAEQRAKAEADAIRQLGARLNAEKDVTEAARVRYEIEQGAYQEFTAAGKERLNTLAAELDLQKESAEVSDYLRGIERQRREDAEAASQAKNEERRRVLESLRSPEQTYAAEVQQLLDLGIGGEELARGIDKARDAFEIATSTVQETRSAAQELGLTFTSAFEDAVIGGENLRGVLSGLADDILRITLQKTVTEPLGNGIADLIKTAGNGNGIFGAIASIASGLFGNAKGGLYRVGGSGGGEMPVAFTARQGEIVAVGTGMEGGGGMHVVVNNYSNANVQTRERRNPNGRRELEVTVGELVQSNVAAGRTSGIGLVPPLVSR